MADLTQTPQNTRSLWARMDRAWLAFALIAAALGLAAPDEFWGLMGDVLGALGSRRG